MPSTEFSQAAEKVKSLKKEPSNDEKLECYALFKVFYSLGCLFCVTNLFFKW